MVYERFRFAILIKFLIFLHTQNQNWLSDSAKVLRWTQHKIGHSEVIPSQSSGLVLKKLNLTQQKQTTQEQDSKNTQKADLNLQKT